MKLYQLSGTQALAALEAGMFSAVDYVTALLDRAQEYAWLNAFSHLDEELILADAKASDEIRKTSGTIGPLHGLPIAIKNNINVARQPTPAGTPGLRDHCPASDAAAIATLRRAGAILFGRTNMHELAYGLTSNNPAFGAVRNPHNPDMIAGGSSGGSAAAVAANIVPVALGTDTGGSVRQPAALCGLVGFRPTHGRYSSEGIVPLSHSRDTVGALTRNVEDAVLLDQVLGGKADDQKSITLGNLRIGVPRGYFYETLDPEITGPVERALAHLLRFGVELVEVDVPGIENCNAEIGRPIVWGEVIRDLPHYLKEYADGITIDDILNNIASPDVREIARQQFDPENRGDILAAYAQTINHSRPALRQKFKDYFADHRLDAMAFPTTIIAARPIGQDETIELAGKQVPTSATYVHNTGPSSIIGTPGLTLPVGTTSAGLPVGLEFDALAEKDSFLLAIGMALEECKFGIA